MIAGLAGLVTLPAAIAALPVAEPDIDPATLQERILASAAEPYGGLYESRGGLRLPDLGRFDDEIAPFAETRRVRVWYADPERWRADELSTGGERGYYREPGGLWIWESGNRDVEFYPRDVDEPPRIPRLMDLSPAELGRRIVRETVREPGAAEVAPIAARRIAGRVAAGLRITSDSPTTTISAVDVWADPSTGIVLAVEIFTGGTLATLETAFLDFSTDAPGAATLTFDPDETDVLVESEPRQDPVEVVAGTAFLPLPDELGGLPVRSDTAAGVRTYGDGFSIVSLFAVPQSALGRGLNSLPESDRPWGGRAIVLETALVNAQVVRLGGLAYVLSGTVTMAELDRIAGELTDEGGLP